jgi:hypothetical protein
MQELLAEDRTLGPVGSPGGGTTGAVVSSPPHAASASAAVAVSVTSTFLPVFNIGNSSRTGWSRA